MSTSERPAETRALLLDAVSALLQGPGSRDESITSAPADTYLTGILWPRGSKLGAAEDEGEVAGSAEDGGGDSGVPGYRTIRPCSIGLTFSVRPGVVIRVSTGTTARYESEGEKEARKWNRKLLGYSFVIGIAESRKAWANTEYRIDSTGLVSVDPKACIYVRRRVRGDEHIYTVTLVNENDDSDEPGSRDARCLFQAQIMVHAALAEDGAIRSRRSPAASADDEDGRTNALLYRNVSEFAAGHGIAAMWGPPQDGRVSSVWSEWLPRHHVQGTSPAGHPLLRSFLAREPDLLAAAFLAVRTRRRQITALLREFVDIYEEWIARILVPQKAQFDGVLAAAATSNESRCRKVHRRMLAGVDALQNIDTAWESFVLANQAMDDQSRFPARGDAARPLVWRPFQLAFMLLVIPGLVDPERADRECMDLLWFPTGGGKTEAYLALTAFQIFHQRLCDSQRRQHGGVDVLMRYTLRLLTVQQFQRAAALISACDRIRARNPSQLGTARITLGLYVGAEATPNKMDAARAAIADEQAGRNPSSTPRQLLRCPVCGVELTGSSLRADPDRPLIEITCPNNGCLTAGEPLPVFTVDATIYESPPSLLIGTIDKFAQMPRSTEIRKLFGLDSGAPPGMIIQDELHLISGPLGSMAGLYETVIDLLASRGARRPKIIGSTATIGQAGAQVRALFDRDVLQFPPPGFDAGDSYFAVRDEVGPDRLYVGLTTAGRSPKFALQAVVAALLQAASGLLESGQVDVAGIDPYWTCVAYFNSLRELGGAHVLMQDDVPRQMRFLATRQRQKQRELDEPIELSSRVPSRKLPEMLGRLGTTVAESEADPFGPAPADTVLASNMISVGVDVPRLGLMVVNGQPKSTAEYIQASSRVGRGIPGLVLTLYNAGRPRDLSHFEHFSVYHGALYRGVEATSVTPWAPRARDKALHAILAASVRHLLPSMLDDGDAARFDESDIAVQALVDGITGRIERATGGQENEDARADLKALAAEWTRRAVESRRTGGTLHYWKRRAKFGTAQPHLMYSAEEGVGRGTAAWPTPNTMREVEPSTAFRLKKIQSAASRRTNASRQEGDQTAEARPADAEGDVGN